MRSLLTGAAAGAVGTAALNVVSYGDMAVRARPASEMPQKIVQKAASSMGLEDLASDSEAAVNRRTGIGSLLGYANGLGVGAVYGILRPLLRRVPVAIGALAAGAAVMALSDVPASRSGATDTKTWSAADWTADVIPHALFGLALALSFDALDAR